MGEESDRKAKEESDRKAKEESDRKAKEESERKAKEEADRKAKEVAQAQSKPAAPASLDGQPPSSQQWNGHLLSTCCEEYYRLVRNDESPITWVLLKHENNTKVRAEAVGSGGLNEVHQHLTEK